MIFELVQSLSRLDQFGLALLAVVQVWYIVCGCPTLTSFSISTHWTLCPLSFLFGSVKLSLVRYQDQVSREFSLLTMCLNSFLIDPIWNLRRSSLGLPDYRMVTLSVRTTCVEQRHPPSIVAPMLSRFKGFGFGHEGAGIVPLLPNLKLPHLFVLDAKMLGQHPWTQKLTRRCMWFCPIGVHGLVFWLSVVQLGNGQ